MKIYVACHCQDTARNVAVVLSTAGHEITSRWLHADFKPTDQHREPDRPVIAQEDFDDVAAADALVLVAGPDRYPGGKFVETGIALGMGKHVVVIGRRENMLIWLPAIQQVDDPQGAVDFLAALSASPSPVDSRDGEEDKIGPHEQALRDAVEPFLDWLEQREEGAHIKEVREGLIGVEDVIHDDHVVLGAHPRAQKDQGVLTIGHFRRLRDVYDGNVVAAKEQQP